MMSNQFKPILTYFDQKEKYNYFAEAILEIVYNVENT